MATPTEERLARLEREVLELRERVWLLLACKQDDSTRSYWCWMLHAGISDEKRHMAGTVLLALHCRLKKERFPFPFQRAIRRIGKQFGISDLLRTERPTFDVALKALQPILGVHREGLIQMLKAHCRQGLQGDIAKHLLLDAGEKVPRRVKRTRS